MTSASHYLHGVSEAEQQRLDLLNSLSNEASLEAIDLRGGERVLDVGCGTGVFTCVLARAVGPTGCVVGVERDDQQLAAARNQAKRTGVAAAFRAGSAEELSLDADETGSYDVAHARFLLEHVHQPERVVAEMVRAVRPGGRVVLQDDDHDLMRLWPEPPGFAPLWKAYIRAYDKLGNDPFVGRRLVAMLHAAGAKPVRNDWIFFGACQGNPAFVPVIDNMLGIIETARRVIVDTGLLEKSSFDAAMTALEDFKQQPDGAMWFATAWAEARIP